jgi:hypothetical protein
LQRAEDIKNINDKDDLPDFNGNDQNKIEMNFKHPLLLKI